MAKERSTVINRDEFLKSWEARFCPQLSDKKLEDFFKKVKVVYEKKDARGNYNIYPIKLVPVRTDCCNFIETEIDGKYCDQIGDGSQSISLERGCIENCILYHKKHKPQK